MKHGFIRIATAIPSLEVANCTFNAEQIQKQMTLADARGVEILCLPELSITGYTCQDLFQQQLLLDQAEIALLHLADYSRNCRVITIVGLPVQIDNRLYNCAAVIGCGKVLGLVPKTHLPNYNEFYEQRWFASSLTLPSEKTLYICGQDIPVSPRLLFSTPNCCFGIEICEDLWATIPPSCHHALAGAEIVFNLSASNELVGKGQYLRDLVKNQSARCLSGYVYVSCGYGESTQDTVYGGRSYIAENGIILAESTPFSLQEQLVVTEIDVDIIRHARLNNTTYANGGIQESFPSSSHHQQPCTISIPQMPVIEEDFQLTRTLNSHPFVPRGEHLNERCKEILAIQSAGLAKRIQHTHAKTVVVGVSGGLDSTLALLVCAHTFDLLGMSRKGIVGITMPGFGTTDRTYHNAVQLMKDLDITTREINIGKACQLHLQDLGHDGETHDVTYENAQARERTQILMDAANQMNGLVIGTGDLSELALGWATYNGDHMSMYGVNAGIPKTLIRHMVTWIANNLMDEYTKSILLDIVDTPISPELIPAKADGTINQKTEDLVGPYELHDFFLYHMLRHGARPRKIYWLATQAFKGEYTPEVIAKWLREFSRRFFQQQFKRSCLPDGPKVGSCSLSPRSDWRMPTDASAQMWLKECDDIATT